MRLKTVVPSLYQNHRQQAPIYIFGSHYYKHSKTSIYIKHRSINEAMENCIMYGQCSIGKACESGCLAFAHPYSNFYYWPVGFERERERVSRTLSPLSLQTRARAHAEITETQIGQCTLLLLYVNTLSCIHIDVCATDGCRHWPRARDRVYMRSCNQY